MTRPVPPRTRTAVAGATAAFGLVAVLAIAAGRAQDSDLRNTVDEAVNTRAATQQRQDAWAAEREDLLARYRAARETTAWLEQRRDAAAERVDALAARVAELERRLAEADRLEGSMQDTLVVLVDRLADAVDRSLPFLAEERAARLESVRGDLARPDVPSAEKLRRVLEALLVEAGYGGSVEVVQERITAAGESLTVDVLRLGRAALFWRTPDGARAGVYDPGAAAWVETGAAERRRIGLAMDMAARTRPVEVVDLPLGRIAP